MQTTTLIRLNWITLLPSTDLYEIIVRLPILSEQPNTIHQMPYTFKT